jgi:anti-sigma-K factor RskA
VTDADRDEPDALAGEYVLGTLSPDERRAAEARLASDAAFRAAVAAWRDRLQPLADAAPPVEPPAGTYDRILQRLEVPAALYGADNVVALRRSLRRWRIGAVAAAALAAGFAGLVVVDRVSAPPSEFVAVLTAEGAKPVFVATVDVARGTLSIRRIGEAPPPDKSYELWAVEPNARPKSLGVIEQASYTRDLSLPAKDLVLAVSLEPKGGSPTGVATGPVLFTGAIVPAR